MDIDNLKKIAREVRRNTLKMIAEAGSGHTAGSLSSADLYTAFYFAVLNHDAATPNWDERDRLVVSCGHTCPAQYAALAAAGYFPLNELKTHRKIGSRLQGHPVRGELPGIETTSGPLGCGLAQAAGIALASRMDGMHFRTYCLTSDGEHQSGNHWEAVAFAAKYQLANLTVFVDRNGIQIDGITEEVMPLGLLSEKYRSFNWNVIDINGHDFDEITNAVKQARAVYDKPTAVIANTVAGKGVSFMENNFLWHGRAPDENELKAALIELR